MAGVQAPKGIEPLLECSLEQGRVGGSLYGRSSRGGIQFLMESWASPTSSSPCEASSSSFQVNCSRSGSATHAAVSVLY